MTGPEYNLRDYELIAGRQESLYSDGQIIAMGLSEIYQPQQYDKILIPDEDREMVLNAEGTHLAIKPPESPIRLAKFLPGVPIEEEDRFDMLVRQQLFTEFRAGTDPDAKVSDEDLSIVQQAVELMNKNNLHVFGAIQISRYVDGVRSVVIYVPNVFTQMFGSVSEAAELSAAFLKHVE